MKRWMTLCLWFVSVCLTGYAQDVRVIHVDEPGTLANVLPEGSEIGMGETLKIIGGLNNSDFNVFKKLEYNNSFSLDLSEANVETIPFTAFSYYNSGSGRFPLSKILLPSSVKRIEKYAFYKCDLSEVDLTRCSNLNFVGILAFGECVNLQSVDFSKCRSLLYLGGEVDNYESSQLTFGFFYGSSRLETVILPPLLERLYLSAFNSCESMREIEIPASLKWINGHMESDVFTITKIRMRPEIAPSISYDHMDPFDGSSQFNEEIYKNCVIEVPRDSKGYFNYEPWISFHKQGNVKYIPVPYDFKVACNAGGLVKIGDKTLQTGTLIFDRNSTVDVIFIPESGYHVKSVTLNGADVLSQVRDNKLQVENITENMTLNVTFEQDVPVTYTVKVSCNAGGTVKVNGKTIPSGSSETVNASTDVTVSIVPNAGYHIKSVKLGETDVTSQVSSENTLVISSISSNQELSVAFEQDTPVTYSVKVTYNTGGTVKVNDKPIASGSSETVNASTDVTVSIVPNAGYHIKNVKLGETDVTSQVSSENTLVISSISSNQELSVAFEQDTPVNYSVKVTYNTGGTVKINDKPIANGSSETVNASTDVTVSIVPASGYHVKSVKLGATDVTSQVTGDNTLVISSISEDKELEVVFEQTTYIVKVTYNAGGTVKVNNSPIANGSAETVKALTDVQVSIIPNEGYLLKQVKLGEADVTDQIVNHILTIPEIAGDRDVTVVFEKGVPVTNTLKVSYSNGGTVKVNNLLVESGISLVVQKLAKVSVCFVPDEGFALKQVLLDGADVTNRLVGNVLEIPSVSADLEIVAFFEEIPTVSCIVNIVGNGVVKVNGQQIKHSLGFVSVEKGETVTFSFIPDTGYELGKVLMDNQEITGQVKNNTYRIVSLISDVTCQVEFVLKEGSSTSIDQVSNTTKRVYRSAPRRLALSGFEAGVPVYVYDGSGRLVVLKTIRDSVEVVDVPADGLYFVRIGKESFKVIL